MATLTQKQIQDFVVKAKAAGFTSTDIQKEIVRKQNEVAQPQQPQEQFQTPATPPIQQQQPVVQQQPIQQPQQPATPEQPQDNKGFVSKFFDAIIAPGKRYAQFVGEAVGQGARSIFQGKERDELFKKADAGTATDEDLKRLQELTNPIFMPQERFEKMSTPKGIALETLKSTAGGASYVIPGGAGWKALVASGMVSGGLYSLSQDDTEGVDVENLIKGTAIGGATSGVLYGAGKVLKGAAGKVMKGLEDRAAQGITKATPSQWVDAVESHGLSLNDLTKKYFPKGGTYDDLLGGIAERGKGGLLGGKIKTAEKVIDQAIKDTNVKALPIDDIVTKLNEEKELLSIMPGNESNMEALQQFIEAVRAKYAQGIAPKQALILKRAADSKFGEAVVNEESGSIVAQAQKMFANVMRKELKQALPQVKDALETETEIYTLRPILERARGISQTPGSAIRIGRIDSLQDLINPMAWLEKAMGTEQFASKFLRGEKNVPLSAIEQTTKRGLVAKKVGEVAKTTLNRPATLAVGANALEEATKPSERPVTTIAPETQAPAGTTQAPTPTKEEQVKEDVFGGRSKSELLLLASSMGATNKDLQEISDRYDLLTGTGGKAPDYTETEQAAMDTSFLIDQAVNMLNTTDIKTGMILAPVESFKGRFSAADQNTLSFNILMGNLKATLAKARAGTSFTPNEEALLNTYTPSVGDSRQEIETKLKGLKTLMDNKLKNIGGK